MSNVLSKLMIKKVRFNEKTVEIIVERLPSNLWYSAMELQAIINESKEVSTPTSVVSK